MEAARTIRDSVQQVSRLRDLAAADPQLQGALLTVKRLQSRRFSGSYADMLQGGSFAVAARFFLEELYGDRDYADRDEQFARIAGAIDTFVPAQVARTAADLAALHALTEDLDFAMARAWLRADGSDVQVATGPEKKDKSTGPEAESPDTRSRKRVRFEEIARNN